MNINQIFYNHYSYYKSVGAETIMQQSGQYRQVEDAYQGRAIFELLQNAIDRADKAVLVELLHVDGEAYLIVANDGTHFSFGSDYDYTLGGSKRYDFQSLCSIATSTKNARENIGNKGVGFKAAYTLNDYAEIYTHGHVLPEDIFAEIDFRLYDLFTKPEQLEFAGAKCGSILKNIHNQNQNQKCGIPGFYFPERIIVRPDHIKPYFEQGYVTVICIPVRKNVDIRSKIESIGGYQYYFIPTKDSFKEKRINLRTCIDRNVIFSFEIKPSRRVVSQPVPEETKAYGRAAGIDVDDNSCISLFFREDSGRRAIIYNFLPTEMSSPFANIDINADFHTSVNRKNIEVKGEEPIAKYNRALLRQCMALVRECFVDKTKLPDEIFHWAHFALEGDTFRSIFKDVFENDFAQYAADVFKKRKPVGSNLDKYYQDFIFDYIVHYHSPGDWWNHYKDIANEIGKKLNSSRMQFLGDTGCLSDNIFYRKDSGETQLPDTVKAEFTSYNVNHWLWGDFKNGAHVQDFSNAATIYRLFRQCSEDGFHAEESISEEQQLDILVSVALLMNTEKDREAEYAAWRYSTLPGSSYSDIEDKSRGAFALATLFYKTTSGRYKPGQLLCKCDIDTEFLKQLTARVDNINALLHKTGVSTSNRYTYYDQRLFKAIGDGLDFIPAPGYSAKIRRGDLWSNVRIGCVTHSRHLGYHPAELNENYSIFARIIRNQSNKNDFNALLVGNYSEMPEEYFIVLSNVLKNNTGNYSEMLRFFSKFFDPLLSNGIVLVKSGAALKVEKNSGNCYGVSERCLLDSNVSVPFPILAAIIGGDAALKFRIRQIDIKITIDKDASVEFDAPPDADRIYKFLADESRQAVILAKIDKMNLPDYDFGNNEDRRAGFYDRLSSLQVDFYHSLKAQGTAEINGISEVFDLPGITYLFSDGTLSIEVGDESSNGNVARALSVRALGSERFADIFELVIFSDSTVSDQERAAMARSVDSGKYIEPLETQIQQSDVRRTPDYEIPTFKVEKALTGGDRYITDVDPILLSKGNGGTSGITEDMSNTGLKGEEIVAQQIARDFLDEYRDDESRAAAIASINAFLNKHKFSEIIVKDNSYTLDNVREALWYTKNATRPFDIITVSGGRIRLLEVKSTKSSGKIRMYFSKREMIAAAEFREEYCIYLCDLHQRKITIYGNIFPDKVTFRTDGYIIRPNGFEVTICHI